MLNDSMYGNRRVHYGNVRDNQIGGERDGISPEVAEDLGFNINPEKSPTADTTIDTYNPYNHEPTLGNILIEQYEIKGIPYFFAIDTRDNATIIQRQVDEYTQTLDTDQLLEDALAELRKSWEHECKEYDRYVQSIATSSLEKKTPTPKKKRGRIYHNPDDANPNFK